MINSIKIDKIKDSSRLYIDYLYHFDKLKRYYASDYRSLIDSGYLSAREIEGSTFAKTAEILRDKNRKWSNLSAIREGLKQLNQKGAKVVVTGQQLGLLTGPLYTIYKALAAVKLASYINSRFDQPVAPIFWLEGEDHDLTEANKICMLDLQNKPHKLQLEGFPSKNRVPVGELHISEGIEDLLQSLEEINPNSEFNSTFLQMVKESYTPSALWKDSFSRLIIRLLGKYAPLLIDASDKRWKQLTRPIFEKAILYADEISKIIQKNNEQLKKDGYQLQVKFNLSSTNLFLKVEGAKYLLQTEGKGYFILKGEGKRFSQDALLKLVEEEPERFVPNVLLRPIVQDYLLPTLAYVAGPAEIAYFSQIKPLYNFFGVEMPYIFPRPSLTLVEKKIDKVIKKLKIDLNEFFTNPEIIIEKIMNERAGKPIDEPFTRAEEELQSLIEKLRKVLISIDSTLNVPLQKAAMKMRYQLSSLRNKYLKASRKAYQTEIEQIEKLKNNLFPWDDLQERCLNIIPFLTRYGHSLVDKIYDNIELDNLEHKLIYL